MSPHVATVGSGLSLKALITQLVLDLTRLLHSTSSLRTSFAALTLASSLTSYSYYPFCREGEEQTLKKGDASIGTLAKWYDAKYRRGARPPLVAVLQQVGPWSLYLLVDVEPSLISCRDRFFSSVKFDIFGKLF